MNRNQRSILAFFLALNAFLVVVAIPVILFSEDGLAQERTSEVVLVIPPIGGLAPKEDHGFHPGQLLRKALVEQSKAISGIRVLEDPALDQELRPGTYEPAIERSMTLAHRVGASHVLQVRMNDHLKLDGNIYAVSFETQLRNLGDRGRIMWRGRSVRAFSQAQSPWMAAQAEASKILSRAFYGVKSNPGDEPPEMGRLVEELPPPHPTTFPEVEYTGKPYPKDSIPMEGRARADALPEDNKLEVPKQTEFPKSVRRPAAPSRQLDRNELAAERAKGLEPLFPEDKQAPVAPEAQARGPAPMAPLAPRVESQAIPAAALPRRDAPVSIQGFTPVATLYFATNSSSLSSENLNALNSLVAAMDQYPAVPVVIEGHADHRGNSDYNYELSLKRAEAVRSALAAKGLKNPGRMKLRGLSDQKPEVEGNSQKQLAHNRRAVIWADLRQRQDRQQIESFLPALQASLPKDRPEYRLPTPKMTFEPTARVNPQALGPNPRVGGLPVPSLPAVARPPQVAQAMAPVSDGQKRLKEILSRIRRLRTGGAMAPAQVEAAPAIPVPVAGNAVGPATQVMASGESGLAIQGAEESETIQIGDSLQVSIQGNSELSRAIEVGADGGFVFPLLGRVQAQGLTTFELAEQMTAQLTKYIKNPIVRISKKYKIRVFGLVTTQGAQEYNHPPSIPDILAEAGGVEREEKRQASENGGMFYGVFLLRIVRGGESSRPYNLSKYLETGKGFEGIKLRNGDNVFVEWDKYDPVTIFGTTDTSLIYRPGLRLLGAIALAGGIVNLERQNIKNVRIFRRLENGRIQRMEVNLQDLMHRGQINRDIELQPGDYVVVPKRRERRDFFGVLKKVVSPFLQLAVLGNILGD